MKELNGSVGGFQILGHWASSTAGDVYAVRDEKSAPGRSKLYAMTVLAGKEIARGGREHMAEAIKAQSTLMHDGIARQYDVLEHGGRLCVISDFVPGETLGHVLRADRSAALGVSMAAAIARMLRDAHRHFDPDTNAGPLVHGDLCPANVLVTFDGRMILTNFGLALSQSRLGARQLRGHIGYMAPERATVSPVTGASDVFSLGLMLFEMFASTPAYRGSTDGELMSLAVKGRVPPLASRVRCSEALQSILNDALHPDPTQRPGAEDLSKALGNLRSSRLVGFDVTSELAKLMDRRFQHKSRAWRTLEARWTTEPLPRRRSGLSGSLPAGLPPLQVINPQRTVSSPGVREPSRDLPRTPPGVREPSRDLPRVTSRELPLPREIPRDLPAAALSLDNLAPFDINTGDIPARMPEIREESSRDLPPQPPQHLSFVRGVVICWLIVMVLTASTLLWPTDWMNAALAFFGTQLVP